MGGLAGEGGPAGLQEGQVGQDLPRLQPTGGQGQGGGEAADHPLHHLHQGKLLQIENWAGTLLYIQVRYRTRGYVPA